MLTGGRREPVLARAGAGRAAAPPGRRALRPGPGSRPEARIGRFAAGAVAFHLLLVAALVFAPRLDRMLGSAAFRPPPDNQATIEMVMENTPTVGGSKRRDATSPRHAVDPTPSSRPTPLTSRNSEDTVRTSTATETEAPPAPKADEAAAEATQRSAETATAMPDVNLDPDADPGWGIATGPDITPAAPDSHVNAPPLYPRDAVDRGEQGLVGMIVSVAPDGHASNVQIVSSSGYPRLDQEALRAVEKWRFKPAVKNGQKVASIFNQQIDFRIGAPPRASGGPAVAGGQEP